ncbi:MAG: YkgJ family cysteine cluster protein [Planctomycetota bacterium]|jgi:Fe-S-cluster containining protein
MKKWYYKGLKFTCTKCGNCCRANGDYAYVYVTTDEVQRIMKFLDIPRKEFMRNHCSRLEGRTIIKFKDGVCSLAEDNLCSVYRVRPVQCRAWPFWVENLDEWVWYEEVASICPGANRGKLYSKQEIEKIAKEAHIKLEAEVEDEEEIEVETHSG